MTYLAVDIGPKFARVVSYRTLDPSTQLASKVFPVSKYYVDDFSQLTHICKLLAGNKPCGIALAVAGQVSQDRRYIEMTGSLTHWQSYRIVDGLVRKFECPVFLCNDAEADAMAEAHKGRERLAEFTYVLWELDRGVGATVIRRKDGKPVLHPKEFGHQIIDVRARESKCGCGIPGCLESLVGGWALSQSGYTLSGLTSEQRDEIGWLMATGLYNAMRLDRTDVIAVGGSLVREYPALLIALQQQARKFQGKTIPPVRLADVIKNARSDGALALLGQWQG